MSVQFSRGFEELARLWILSLAILLAACDTSGGSDPIPPTAAVVSNVILSSGQATVTLDGSPSRAQAGHSIRAYQWQQASGPAVTIASPAAATTTITAPDSPNVEVLQFTLTVTDDRNLTGSTSVRVDVEAARPPTAAVTAASITVNGADPVVLDGTPSSAQAGQSILSYHWAQISGPAVVIGNDSAASASFTAPPAIVTVQSLSFRLTVIDSRGLGDTTDVQVTVAPAPAAPPPTAPIAAVVANFIPAASGVQITLDGTPSRAETGHSIVSFAWVQDGGPGVVLGSADGAVSTFVTPVSTGSQILDFTLTVRDDRGLSGSVGVRVSVAPAVPPSALVLSNLFNVDGGDLVQFVGTPSLAEPGQSIVSYHWIQLSGSSVTIVNAASAVASITAPAATASPQSLTFQLTVLDSRGLAGSTGVLVNVMPAVTPQPPTAAVVSASITVSGGASVTLDGSPSTAQSGQTIASYRWEQLSGPLVTLAGEDEAVATFTAPDATPDVQTLSFRLIVVDSQSLSDTIEVIVTVVPESPPVARISIADSVVMAGTNVVLDGTSSSAEFGHLLTQYQWLQTGGAAATLANDSLAMAGFAAPAVASAEVLSFSLTVTDDRGLTGLETVQLTVIPATGSAPVISSVLPRVASNGQPVKLSGHGFAFATLSVDGNPLIPAVHTDHEMRFALPASGGADFALTVTNPYGAASTTVEYADVVDAVKIAIGSAHACAIVQDSTVRCWGANVWGQLGDGTSVPHDRAVTVSGLSGAVDIAAGGSHSCAVLSTGATHCWGRNNYGQLGDATTINSLLPVTVRGGGGIGDLADAAQVVAGDGHSCARLSSGEVRCWGIGSAVGDGTGNPTSTPVTVRVSGAVLGGVIDIEAGNGHTCAVAGVDREMSCWGANWEGQLGAGGFGAITDGRRIDVLPSVLDMALGSSHTCALLPPVGGILSCPGGSACIAGGLACWGGNHVNQRDVGPTTPIAVPDTAGGFGGIGTSTRFEDVLWISAGSAHTCAGFSTDTVSCWGYDEYGQAGEGRAMTARLVHSEVGGQTGLQDMVAGGDLTCAHRSDGTVHCFGNNQESQAGTGQPSSSLLPVTVSGLDSLQATAAGGHHACAVRQNGTVWCWGANWFGQLGTGDLEYSNAPRQVSGIATAVAVSATFNHSCAVLADGSARCWGANFNGQLGNNSGVSSSSPVAVAPLSNATSISSALSHTCARISDGSVRCWGDNNYGQLGLDPSTTSGSLFPLQVAGVTDALDVHVGNTFSCARIVGGGVKCWGYNQNGQLGDGTGVSTHLPVDVAGLPDVIALEAGIETACAIRSGGALYCWGVNEDDNLGGYSAGDAFAPVAITDIANALAVSVGQYRVCAVRSDRTVSCFGRVDYGHPDDAYSPIDLVATSVPGLVGAGTLAVGTAFNCAQLQDGHLQCWGNDDTGQGGWTNTWEPTGPVLLE